MGKNQNQYKVVFPSKLEAEIERQLKQK